jgi:hypothetical protein
MGLGDWHVATKRLSLALILPFTHDFEGFHRTVYV